MLARCYRLTKYQDFVAVYQHGERLSSSCLGLRTYQRRKDETLEQCTRLGISVSRKVSKRAVVRNQIKRQLRAACRQLLPQLQPSWDVVIVVRSGALQCDYHKFLQQLKQLFTDAEILDGR